MTCGDALDKYLRKYERSGRRGLPEVERRIRRKIRPFFGDRPAEGLTTRDLEEYANARAGEGAKDSTIRAELAALRRALKLSYVQAIPALPHLEVSQPRRGYLSIPDFCRLRAAMPDYLFGPTTFAYMTGWRIRSEVLPLRREYVDLANGLVTIPTSKNREPRRFPIDLTIPDLGSLRSILEAGLRDGHPLVFTRRGKRIKCFRISLINAMRKTGLSTRPHDWRRSAVTNLHRAGVQTKLAMKLVGHRTIQTHMDYVQEDDSDLRDAVSQLQAFYSKTA